MLEATVFLLAVLSGVTAYRLGRSRTTGEPPHPALVRTGTLLAYAWLALSALLFAWAAARMLA
ncbi:MAG TPA: hypothetical protein VGB79_17150 [Allosphingosinicella sp.]|jgi:hypothetical protein